MTLKAMSSFYFSNAVASIWLEPTYVRAEYKPGPRKFEDFKMLVQHLQRAIALRGTGKALIDQRNMTPYTEQEQAYFLQEWLPLATVEAGYRYGAILQATDVFARLASTTTLAKAQQHAITYKPFTDEQQAVEWLMKQPR